jgi:hypothetical protein
MQTAGMVRRSAGMELWMPAPLRLSYRGAEEKDRHQMTKLWDIYEVGSGFAVEDRRTAKRHSYHRTLEGAEKALGRLQAKGAAVVTHQAPKSKPKSKAKKPFRVVEIRQKRVPKRQTELTRREEDEANGQWRYRRRTVITRPRGMVSGGLPGLGKRR